MKDKTKASLPGGWQLVRLGDVCTGVTNCDPSNEPDREFYYIDISSIDGNAKEISSPKKLSGRQAPSRARQILKVGDVLVSTTRPNLNAVALVGPEYENQIASTGFCVLRANQEIADPEYLFAFVRSTDFVQALTDLVQGALYPAVTDKQVRSQLIPLPSIDEQRRIAAEVKEQLALIAEAATTAEAQLLTLRMMPASILRAAFNNHSKLASNVTPPRNNTIFSSSRLDLYNNWRGVRNQSPPKRNFRARVRCTDYVCANARG